MKGILCPLFYHNIVDQFVRFQMHSIEMHLAVRNERRVSTAQNKKNKAIFALIIE